MRSMSLAICALTLSTAAAFGQIKPAPAYLIAEFTITDPAGMKAWGEKTTPVVKAHGGEFLARRTKTEAAAGEPPPNVTIIRFDSMEKARAYINSAENKALAPERDKAGKFRNFLVQGASE